VTDPAVLAQRARDRAAIRSRNQTAAVADIGDIPAVADPERREACRLDLHRFLTTYFPASTGLSPFSEDHTRVIGRIQRCVLEGGLFVNAVYRGFAKTTISENAAIWATLYGHRRYVPVFGGEASLAEGNIESIKLELSENDLLYGDFPEACHAIRKLEGKPQRCASQTYQGQLTHIGWTADEIVFPSIPDAPGAGAILTAKGITAASRGMKHKRADGTQQRPDFIIIDDPQTEESASSPVQIKKRLTVIRKSILKLGGHSRKLAVVMNATVIEPDDLVDQLLDQRLFPSWQGERIKMVRKFADVHETLWLNDYRQLRNTYDPDTLGDQQRAHREATAFYRANRAKMDAGCVVSWMHCFDHETELSAIQHAYNLLIDDGPEVFASECQNEPIRVEEANEASISAKDICAKTTGRSRGEIPATASHVVAFIDIQKNVLFWSVMAVGDDFSGEIVDYGTFPDQKRRYFGLADVKRTLQKETKTDSTEAAIYAGLDACVSMLMNRAWKREDGADLKPERIGIDANWGESTDVVYQFCKQSPHAGLLLPCHGRFVGAMSKPFGEYHRKPGDRSGLNWRMPNVQGKRSVRYVLFDSNWWKSFLFSRLRVPMGGRGCLSLFGAEAEEHQMFADHLLAERGEPVTAKGRTVTQWTMRQVGLDNHWLDCAVGCCVMGSISGASLSENTVQRIVKRHKVKLSELQKAKHGARR
jgi:hypothetical protein